MLKNYLTVALRALRRHPTYTLVNVTGLALGMTCCALILMLVHHHWSFDRFHTDQERIVRTYFQWEDPAGDIQIQAMMTPGFTEDFRQSFPQVERATPYVAQEQNLQVGDQVTRFRLAEVHNDFLQMFSFPVVAGDAAEALVSPDQMVVTRSTAVALFGLDPQGISDAVGRTVSISRGENTYDFTVSAVTEDVPSTSSITFDALINFENYERLQLGGNNWGGRVSTWALLVPGATAADLLAASDAFTERIFGPYVEALRGSDQIAEGDDAWAFRLQPLSDLHMTPEVWAPYEAPRHNPMYSWILGGIGLMILLIACINFMTLSVGQSAGRARKVGVRKVLGAHRSQLMKQYFGESTMLALISLTIGTVLTVALTPWFSGMAGAELSLLQASPLLVATVVLSLVVVVGLVAGGYPALVLSRFQPASVLKGQQTVSRSNLLTRSLVVLQYTISIGLIVATMVMTRQLDYLFNKDLGYDREFVVAVQAHGVSRADADGVLEQFRNRLLPFPEITHVARTGSSFTRGSDRNTWQDASGATRSAYNFGVDHDYLNLMGMRMADGRFFSRDFPSDRTRSVVVNQALVDEFGIENPVGATLTNWLEWIYEESPVIIGVVEDFHYRSLHEAVVPAVMNMHPEYYNYMGAILVRVKPDAVEPALERIRSTWTEVRPGQPYEYVFLDDDIAAQYEAEQRWQTILTTSSVLAILIACMGLFGLALLSVTRRTKEIGIRKVMGASISGIAGLVSREFAVLVVVASLLAAPLAWWGMSRWLDSFAFHIEMGPGLFVLASLAALTIALTTVSVHAVRAARINPSDTLRHE
ncbi:MAG: ABC transporter permease, partial [Bacteroidetes bacterium]|nr:ABC transporter permease [Bacteroidota bacterium]